MHVQQCLHWPNINIEPFSVSIGTEELSQHRTNEEWMKIGWLASDENNDHTPAWPNYSLTKICVANVLERRRRAYRAQLTKFIASHVAETHLILYFSSSSRCNRCALSPPSTFSQHTFVSSDAMTIHSIDKAFRHLSLELAIASRLPYNQLDKRWAMPSNRFYGTRTALNHRTSFESHSLNQLVHGITLFEVANWPSHARFSSSEKG